MSGSARGWLGLALWVALACSSAPAVEPDSPVECDTVENCLGQLVIDTTNGSVLLDRDGKLRMADCAGTG